MKRRLADRGHRALAGWALFLWVLSGFVSPLPAAEDPVKTYVVHGILLSFDAGQATATISQEEIPHYMEKMIMTYPVKNPSEFSQLRGNDTVEYHLCLTHETSWIEHVVKTGTAAPLPISPAPAGFIRELQPGDALPDLELIDHRSQKIRLSDFHGQALAITFIYTRCPLPNYCPLMNRNFRLTQELMGKLDAGANWHLFSITLDPDHDTPGVLGELARNIEADDQHWLFASGDVEGVRRFGRSVGLEFAVTTGGQVSHNLRTIVVDPSGRLTRIFSGNTWTAQDLASEICLAMRSHPKG